MVLIGQWGCDVYDVVTRHMWLLWAGQDQRVVVALRQSFYDLTYRQDFGIAGVTITHALALNAPSLPLLRHPITRSADAMDLE